MVEREAPKEAEVIQYEKKKVKGKNCAKLNNFRDVNCVNKFHNLSTSLYYIVDYTMLTSYDIFYKV